MQGISRALAAGPHIDFCGEQLAVRGRILRHHAEIEAQILSRRGNSMDLVRAVASAFSGDTEAAREAVKTAFKEARTWSTVEPHEQLAWLKSWPGKVFSVYLAIRDNDRQKYTLDYVDRTMSDYFEDCARQGREREASEWLSGVLEAIQQASGEDELGN